MVAKDDLARCWALFDIWWATRLILLGLYWECYNGLYRDHIGRMEKNIETTIVYWVWGSGLRERGGGVFGGYSKQWLRCLLSWVVTRPKAARERVREEREREREIASNGVPLAW